MFQIKTFRSTRRKKYNSDVFKTHLLGEPAVCVNGHDHVRHILQSEHKLVTAESPRSFLVSCHSTLEISVVNLTNKNS